MTVSACLHGGGGLQVGEVTGLSGAAHLSIQPLILIWSRLHDRWGDYMRDFMELKANYLTYLGSRTSM